MERILTRLNIQIRITLSDPLRRLVLSIALLALLNGIGTVAYMILEEMSPLDAFYMTVITLATVGFGEIKPLSPEGRIFTIFLILLGVTAATAAISNALSMVLGSLLWSSVQERRMQHLLDTLENHYIICGYGRMGRQIMHDLTSRREDFVLIDSNPDIAEKLLAARIPHVVGDATHDEVLIRAGIKRARGLIAALSSDAGNMMTVLSARELNPDLFIVARVIQSESENKLRRAGANRVVSPYQIGGHRMALALLRPAVHDFLERIFHFSEGLDIDIGQILVREGDRFAGQTVATCDLRRMHNVNILGIREGSGAMIITPDPTQPLHPGATLIVIGPPDAIYKLENEQHR